MSLRLGTLWRALAVVSAAAPALVFAQYSESEMGSYLNFALAAAGGGVYAGYGSIGYAYPEIYTPANGWAGLPASVGFNTADPYYGYATGISRDGTVLAGYTWGTSNSNTGVEYAVYWVNGVESLVQAPPDDPNATLMMSTGISADGSTLLVQDQSGAKIETYVYNIVSQSFMSLGFMGTLTQQTIANAVNANGTVVAGYSYLDNGNIDGFLWTAAHGMQNLGIPPNRPNTVYLEPTCISDDGKTVFGQFTELNGWLGFRFHTTTGFMDTAGVVPSSCTADGLECAGIEFMYFPAVWSVSNGGGYIDDLLTAHGIKQAIGTTKGPVTISPDGSVVTVSGPDVYLSEQTWYGTWRIGLPAPLKTAPILFPLTGLTTPYLTTLNEPAGTLIQNSLFNTGAQSLLVTPPSHASAFSLNTDGSFSYTPAKGFASLDSFAYRLLGPHGHSNVVQVQITVYPHISRLDPPSLPVGSPDTLVTIIGAGFANGDWVAVNGSNYYSATFVSSSELQFTLPASYMAAAGPVRITVEGESNVGTIYVK